MKVLSCFDGMSCGRLALKKAGIKIKRYYSSEIDKYAITVANANFPNTIQLGDIEKLKPKKLPKIDLVFAGSPCQGFSFAGKGLAFDDPRSKLFFRFVKVLNKLKKKNKKLKFLFENVRMKKEYLDIITDMLGVDPICINSSLVSAQNRVRYYWTNIEGVKQPEDKGVLLKDIIETSLVDRDESFCIDANYHKGGNLKSYFEKHRRQLSFGDDIDTIRFLKKAPKTLAYKKAVSQLRSADQKSNCLTTSGQNISNSGSTNLVYKIKDNVHFRSLTPIECERLQTVPDDYTNHVSNTQRYRMLGNGWTVDVIAHILKGLK